MTRKKGGKSRDQMTFNFQVMAEDLIPLQGGSQEELSNFEFRFRQVLKETLEKAAARKADPLDRIEVAARMSRLLGREITKTHLDQWTAMSTLTRRMHVDSLRALCEVVGDMAPLVYFVESCGMKALSPDEADCAEYGAKMLFKQMMDEEIKTTRSGIDERKLRQSLLKRFSGGSDE